jgi:mannose-1-phosphate guanylyltransferase
VNVLILAAGLGTRLRPVTHTVPKPCVPFLNVPMGLYNFRFLKHLNISQLVINTYHLPEKIKELYTTQPYFKNSIQFSDEAGQILGSGGGLKKASSFFKFKQKSDDTILMLNADEILFDIKEEFLQEAYQFHIQENNYATLVTMSHPEAGKKFGGIWCNGSRVETIGKAASSAQQKPQHYIGMIFLNRAALVEIPEHQEVNIFYDFLINKISSEKVQSFNIDCTWFETGNFHDYFEASQNILKKYKTDLALQSFISTYDESHLIANEKGLSLVSQQLNLPNQLKLSGFNCLSKTTNPNLVKDLGLLENSILFSEHLMNQKYFEPKAP